MGLGAFHQFEVSEEPLHQVDRTLERNGLLLTDDLVTIHLGCHRTPTTQQHIQCPDQTVIFCARFLCRARVVIANTADLLHHGVISIR